MINDNKHKNSLSNIALQLFSITPHSVMPERLVYILDWQQHTKRRSGFNPFTLEAIAKIQWFYKSSLNNAAADDDDDYLEEIIDFLDDVHTSSGAIEEASGGFWGTWWEDRTILPKIFM